jgi:hypothetical protein
MPGNKPAFLAFQADAYKGQDFCLTALKTMIKIKILEKFNTLPHERETSLVRSKR